MTDPFTEGQREAEVQRELLEVLREDVRAAVQDEVARTAMSRTELDRMIRDAVSRERGRARARKVAVHPAVVAAVGLLVGLAGGVFGHRLLTRSSGDTVAGAGVEAPTVSDGSGVAPGAPVEGAAGGAAGTGDVAAAGTPAGAATAPGRRAARYDSLFAAGAPELEPLVSRLEEAGPAAPVTAAIAAWREGVSLEPGPRRRLHDALVQLALNEEAGAGLALDGLVQRGPCAGNSCGALLDLWEARGQELGMPPLPDEPAAATGELAVAERVLVLRRAEAGGG